MTGLVLTSSEATRSWSSFPMIVIRTPSTIRPELASRRAEHSLPYSDVTTYIFWYNFLLPIGYAYRFLWPLRSVWLLVCVYIRRSIYKILNVCPFDYMAVAGSEKVGPVNRLTTPIEWMLPVAIWFTVLSRYRNCREIGLFNFQKYLD